MRTLPTYFRLRFAPLALALGLLAAIAFPPAIAPAQVQAQEPVSFKRDLAQLLVDSCLACHGPKKAEGGYRIDTFEHLVAAGESTTPAFVAKNVAGSEAYRRFLEADVHERMPLDADPLSPEAIALFKRWIEEGLAFDGPDAKAALASYLPPPKYPAAPAVYAGPVPVTAMQFSPDGTQLLVGGYHEVTVWNPADGQLIRRIGGLGQRIFALSYSPDGQTLAVACGTPGKLGEVRLINPTSGELVRVLTSAADIIFDVAYSPQGDRLATAGADGSVRVFEAATGAQQLAITSHSDWAFAVAWSADGTKLASGSRDKTAKVFDAKTGDLAITYSGHTQPVRGVLFRADGVEIYSSGGDNKIHRWKLADAAKTAEIGFGGDLYKLPAAGEFFFTASNEKKIKQFKTVDQAKLRDFDGLTDWALCSATHLATKRVAGGAFNGEVKVWNLDDGAVITGFIAAPGFVPKK